MNVIGHPAQSAGNRFEPGVAGHPPPPSNPFPSAMLSAYRKALACTPPSSIRQLEEFASGLGRSAAQCLPFKAPQGDEQRDAYGWVGLLLLHDTAVRVTSNPEETAAHLGLEAPCGVRPLLLGASLRATSVAYPGTHLAFASRERSGERTLSCHQQLVSQYVEAMIQWAPRLPAPDMIMTSARQIGAQVSAWSLRSIFPGAATAKPQGVFYGLAGLRSLHAAFSKVYFHPDESRAKLLGEVTACRISTLEANLGDGLESFTKCLARTIEGMVFLAGSDEHLGVFRGRDSKGRDDVGMAVP
jgi:hypothetical protein